jgi:hypothetical protein
MNVLKTFALVALVFLGNAFAEPVVVQGEELKNLIITEKGTTWVLSNETQTQVSFLPDGKVYACDVLKNGSSDCDSGTFTVTAGSVETKFTRWYAKTGGARTIVVEKDGGNLRMNDFEVVQYTRIPTLFQPSLEEIAARKARADAEIATKKDSIAAAEAYRQMEIIKMTAHVRDYGGIPYEIGVEVYPREMRTKFSKSGSYCEVGYLATSLSITSEGNVAIDIEPRFHGCEKIHPEINPVTRKVTVYVTSQGGQKSKTNLNWTLDN